MQRIFVNSATTTRAGTRQSFFASSLRAAAFSVAERHFPNEPTAPVLKTEFPGPATLAYKQSYGEISCNLQQSFPIDLQESCGNYIADADGNKYLDVFTSISCIAMGYNHPGLLAAGKTDMMKHVVANRTGVGINPPKDYKDTVERAFMSVAPPGMNRVTGAMCGTCSVEGAYKVAMISYAQRKRGGMDVPPSAEELASCMDNALPGSPLYSVLSFKSGFHGRTFGSLSSTRTNPLHKLDFPAFDWPAAEPPRYKYPLEDNAEYNREQDAKSLADVKDKIRSWKEEKGSDVVAIILEPIMSEGGDNQISSEFAQSIQDLTKELGIYFIVDEVQTGVCQTGKFWCHEHWNLREAPDFVTFAKKMLSCGFYHNDDTRMVTPFRHFNTFFGDPVRALLTAEQNAIIKEDNLSQVSEEVGIYLRGKLNELGERHPDFIADVRGHGTIVSFDCETVEKRNTLMTHLKKFGVNQGGCGVKSLRLRPTLYFEQKHVDVYIDRLEQAIVDLKQ